MQDAGPKYRVSSKRNGFRNEILEPTSGVSSCQYSPPQIRIEDLKAHMCMSFLPQILFTALYMNVSLERGYKGRGKQIIGFFLRSREISRHTLCLSSKLPYSSMRILRRSALSHLSFNFILTTRPEKALNDTVYPAKVVGN